MTEDEAKLRWCPFAMVPSAMESRALSYNRGIGNKPIPKATTCIGSECMAWRFNPPVVQNTETGTMHDPLIKELVMDEDRYVDVPPTGYCGLAGKP